MAARSDAPRASIVVPAHNRAATVARTIASILTAADVFDPDPAAVEVIVVDDGSTDDTATVLAAIASRDRRVRVVSQPGSGVSAARNAGVRAATGEVLLFVDADDEVAPRWLTLLASALSAGADLAFGAGVGVRPTSPTPAAAPGGRSSARAGTPADAPVDPPDGGRGRETVGGQVGGPVGEPWAPRPLGPAFAGVVGLFNPGCFAVRREVVVEAGGFATPLRFSENTELGLRICAVLEARGPVRSTVVPGTIVTIHLPERGASNAWSDQARFESALYLVEVHADRLARDPRLLASYWAIAGVAAARLDRPGDARRCFLRAARAHPTDPRHLARIALTLLPRVRATAWPASRP